MRSVLLLPSLWLLLASDAFAQPAPAIPAPAIPAPAIAQEPVHEVPFASEGNAVALTLASPAARAVGSVQVRLTEAPAWLSFEEKTQTLDSFEGEAVARFRFDAGTEAPVGPEERLVFAVEDAAGRLLAEKVIRVEAAAPETFALSGNWPNPFRQATKIGYELPAAARVTIDVYDALGRRVRRLEQGRKEAGGHAAQLRAGRLSSGLYFYRVTATLAGGKRQQETGRMVLVR